MFYIFDLNGTLIRSKSGSDHPQTPDDWEYVPGRLEQVLKIPPEEKALATNQESVAKGHILMTSALLQIRKAARGCGIPEDMIFTSFTHPDAYVRSLKNVNDYMRKPNPGMLLDAMHRAGVDRKQTMMIGDKDTDGQAAQAAGCRFEYAHNFFNDSYGEHGR